jgi:biopolymer transport protein ExbB
MTLGQLLFQGDGLNRLLATVLLGMSVASWVVIVLQLWRVHQAAKAVRHVCLDFWQASDWAQACQRAQTLDPQNWVTGLLAVASQVQGTSDKQTLAFQHGGGLERLLLRELRQALGHVQDRLLWGRVLLATVGSVSPFVGLLGTVWGIYLAMGGIADAGQAGIEQVAGPVGEALVMTALGLGVALPAVVAYNVLQHRAQQVQAQLEGFANDVLAHWTPSAQTGASRGDAA